MKSKLLKDVTTHYDLVNSKISPERIKENISLGLTDLYCAFQGFNRHEAGGEMVQYYVSFMYLYTNLTCRFVKDSLTTQQSTLYLNGYFPSQSSTKMVIWQIISINWRASWWHALHLRWLLWVVSDNSVMNHAQPPVMWHPTIAHRLLILVYSHFSLPLFSP